MKHLGPIWLEGGSSAPKTSPQTLCLAGSGPPCSGRDKVVQEGLPSQVPLTPTARPGCPRVTLGKTHLIGRFPSQPPRPTNSYSGPGNALLRICAHSSNFSGSPLPVIRGFHNTRSFSTLRTHCGLLCCGAFAGTVPFAWNNLLPLIHPALVYPQTPPPPPKLSSLKQYFTGSNNPKEI